MMDGVGDNSSVNSSESKGEIQEKVMFNDENAKLPDVKGFGLNKFKVEVQQRREELVLLINDLGFFRARRMAKVLAQKYGVSWVMIYKDFDWIKGHIKPADIREIRIDLRIGTSRAYSEALDMLSGAKTIDEKLKAIQAVIMASKHYREELEAWGEKPKVAEKHEVMSKNISLEIIRHDGRVENKEADGTERQTA